MGHGAFDGGGSMDWEIQHGDRSGQSPGRGHGSGGNGHDAESTTGTDVVVKVNGREVARENSRARVLVLWGRDALTGVVASVTGPSTSGRPVRTSKGASKKAAKKTMKKTTKKAAGTAKKAAGKK